VSQASPSLPSPSQQNISATVRGDPDSVFNAFREYQQNETTSAKTSANRWNEQRASTPYDRFHLDASSVQAYRSSMCLRRISFSGPGLFAMAVFILCSGSSLGAQNRASNAAAFVAQQQAQEQNRRLYTIVEDLQAANLVLQQKIDRLESQLQRALKKMADQQADTVTNEQLDALSQKMTKELQNLEDKRVADNQKILSELRKIASRPVAAPKDPIASVPKKATPPPYTGPVYEVTVEPGYTISAIAESYREEGHNISVEDILRANPGLVPKKIRPGQIINVPAKQ
jgi:LysM repeat protein